MLRRIIAIARKELLHVIRDTRSLALVIIFPVILLILFGYAVSFDVSHLPLAISDLDSSYESRQLISRFINSDYFDYMKMAQDEKIIEHLMDGGEIKVFIKIPPNYSENLIANKNPELLFIIDGSDPTVASVAVGYINSILGKYSQDTTYKIINQKGMNIDSFKMPVSVVTRIWYNPELRSLNFFVPGLLVIIMMMLTATLTSLIIVSEKERGSLEQLIVSPLSSLEIILGKVVPYVLISFIDIILVVVTAAFLFSVPIKGSLVLLFLTSIIFLLGSLGIGIFISTIANRSEEAMMIALTVTMLPTTLLSGFIFPIPSMPLFVRGITYLVPARYFLSIVRSIFLKGVGVWYIWPDVLMLTIFVAIIIFFSVKRFKKRLD